MLKIRRSHDRLIFNMGISIPGKDSLYIEKGSSVYIRLAWEEFNVLFQSQFDDLLVDHAYFLYRNIAHRSIMTAD